MADYTEQDYTEDTTSNFVSATQGITEAARIAKLDKEVEAAISKYETKDSGARAEYDSGMVRDTEEGKARFDLLVPLGVPYEEQMLTRFADLLGRGAEKYSARNWEKANSQAELDRYKSSAFRHFMQWITGETDEDHASATLFNIMCYETVKYKKESYT